MNKTQNRTITVPLKTQAHLAARKFAAQQATPKLGKRAYLNTLAVYAVHDYLEWLEIETDLTQGDSWQPSLQSIFDIADLVVPERGKLECRPILPGETACYLPLESTENRIGYVLVQIEESLKEATLLGFVPLAVTDELRVTELQSLDALLLHLSRIPVPIRLSQWFQNIFEAGWQNVESLLGTQKTNLAFSFRSTQPELTIRRAKQIDLGMQLDGQSVALLVGLTPTMDSPNEVDSEEKIGILLQVHPMGDRTYLPPNVQLILLSESGDSLVETKSRHLDNYIQLEFRGQPGERFSVKVALGDASVTEAFVI